ncbi:MAG: hypothetical protein ACOCY6_02920 [Halodesulfurarchaeum sp.]
MIAELLTPGRFLAPKTAFSILGADHLLLAAAGYAVVATGVGSLLGGSFSLVSIADDPSVRALVPAWPGTSPGHVVGWTVTVIFGVLTGG